MTDTDDIDPGALVADLAICTVICDAREGALRDLSAGQPLRVGSRVASTQSLA